MENKKDNIIKDIETNILIIKNTRDDNIKYKMISITSQLLNKLKFFNLDSKEKHNVLMMIEILKDERLKLKFIDKIFNKIECWFYIDFDMEKYIEELKNKTEVTNKDLNKFFEMLNKNKIKKKDFKRDYLK